jgi:hypothetical protein
MSSDTAKTPSVSDIQPLEEAKPDPTIGARKWENPNIPPIAEDTMDPLAAPPILQSRSRAKGDEPRIPRSYPRRRKKDKELDATLTKANWDDAYAAYADTGDFEQIAEKIDLSVEQVEWLFTEGVRRLGLPAIEDYAVSKGEVALRLQESGLSWKDDKRDAKDTALAKPKVRQAITERVAKEAVAAQAMLGGAMNVAEIFGTLIAEVKQKMLQGKLEVPEEVNLGYLNKLALTLEKLAKAMDIATRLARLTAGEPETHVLHHVTGLIGTMSALEIKEFAETGVLPRSIRGRANEIIDIEPPKK